MPQQNEDEIGTRIVKAAAEAFVEHGFAGTSTRHIAHAAKTSKRAIYERYAGKDELFAEVMRYLCALGEADAAAAPVTDAGLEAFLFSVSRAVLARFALPETRGVFAAAIGALPQCPTVVDIFWQQGPGQAADAVAAQLGKLHRQGDLPRLVCREAATQFIHDCCGPLVLRQLFDAGFSPDDAYLEQLARSAVAALLAKLPPAP